MPYLFFLFLILVGTTPLAPSSGHATEPADCALAVPCQINGRSYHVRAPDDWDGKTKLPVLLHFHGWGRQGKMIMNHRRIAGATRKLGVLLVAPNGEGRTWKIWDSSSQDVPFAVSVLEDVAKRWPLDHSRIFVSGYSYGSVMAWRFACAEGSRINALLAISGSIEDETESCAAPVNVRHVHGTRDNVMGYPYGRDGTVESAVALWRARNNCKAKPDNRLNWQAVKILPFTRHTWANCSSGKSVVLDVHARGHFIPRFWIERQLKELL